MIVRPGLLAGLLGSLIPAAAAAFAVAANSPGAPVVLLGTAEDEPLTGRIAAELRALGIGIEIRVVAGDERRIDVEVQSALRDGARAAVRIDAQTGRTEVSIPDPVTREVALKQVLEGPPTAALVPVLAVRTVEFVRATLLGPRNEEIRRGEGAGARDASPDGELAAGPGGSSPADLSLAQLSGLRLSAASGALFTPGGMSTAFTAGLMGGVRLRSWLGVELMGFAPLTKGVVTGYQTTTSSSTWLAGAGLFARQAVAPRTGVELGAGGLLGVLRNVGNPDMRTDLKGAGPSTAYAISGYVRAGADLALTRNLALHLDLLGGVAFKRAGIAVIENSPNVIAWSRTFAAALGGVEARWF